MTSMDTSRENEMVNDCIRRMDRTLNNMKFNSFNHDVRGMKLVDSMFRESNKVYPENMNLKPPKLLSDSD